MANETSENLGLVVNKELIDYVQVWCFCSICNLCCIRATRITVPQIFPQGWAVPESYTFVESRLY